MTARYLVMRAPYPGTWVLIDRQEPNKRFTGLYEFTVVGPDPDVDGSCGHVEIKSTVPLGLTGADPMPAQLNGPNELLYFVCALRADLVEIDFSGT